MCCSRKFRALMGAFLVAVLAFTPLINVAPIAFAEGDVYAETYDAEVQEANDNESEPQVDDSVTYGGEDLSDWTYTDNGDNTVTLTAYNASATDIIIPGDFGDGKTVKINSFDMLKNKGMTTLQVKASEAGNKVVYDGTSMLNAFISNKTLTKIDLAGLNTVQVTNMQNLVRNCDNLEYADISGMETENLTTIDSMFADCYALKSINLEHFDTSNITAFGGLFGSCFDLETVDVSGFDTSNATGMVNMFMSCQSLKSIDVSNFNTSNVANMEGMFRGCTSLESLDLSNFNTEKVTDFRYMFYGSTKLSYINLSSFSVRTDAKTDYMFDKPSIDTPELPTAIISKDEMLRALEQDGKLGSFRVAIPARQLTITLETQTDSLFSDVMGINLLATNEDTANTVTIQGGGKIFYDSVIDYENNVSLTKERLATLITDPTKDGYRFIGWFTDAGTTNLFERFDLVNDSDTLTLYAGWTAIEPEPTPSPVPEPGEVDNPNSDINGDLGGITDQVADEASVSTATPVTGDNVAIVAGIALSLLILALSTVVFARKRRQQ